MKKSIFITIVLLLSNIILVSLPNQVYGINSASMAGSTLSGYVKDASNKETLIGAMVFLKGTKLGAYTNKSGYYTIKGIPNGEYTVVVKYIGYKPKEKKVDFESISSVRTDILVEVAPVKSNTVTIEAEREIEKREITISKVNVPISQIKEIRIGGEADVFRSLQYLPGVLTSSQISSGLYVRGGSPDQNLVLLDGATVYNPTHLFGFISTFNTNAVKDIELIKGGFPAEYGGRLSSVLNITQKDGNRKEFEGQASIGLISSKLAMEGPVGNGSWFVSGRRTYLELIKEALEDPDEPLPDFNFYDINAKVVQDFGRDDKLFLSGFISNDNLDFSQYGANFGMDVGNKLASLKWTHIFEDDLFGTLLVSGSNYFNNFEGGQSGYEFLIENSITDYTVKSSLEWFTTEKLTHKFGFEYTNYTFDYLQNFTGDTDSTAEGSEGGQINMTIEDYNASLYAQANYQFDDYASLQMGIRGGYWNLSDEFTIDPRIAFRYQINGDIAIKGAFGIYHQNLKLATQPDFSFFDTWLPTDSTANIGRSYHYILSLETNPWNDFDLNFDVYYKTMNDITELKRTAVEAEKISDIFFFGNSRSYGLEVFFQKKIGDLTGWFGYGLGWIEAEFDSINYGNAFRPKYDRRHDLKALLQYKLNESWEFGAVFTYQTGQSYTGATSRFQLLLPGQNYGRGKIIPSERYGLRLPSSHQLNLNIGYNFTTFGLASRLNLDLYNVYNRRDIWFRYYDVASEEAEVTDVKLLPILPTISYEIKF